MSDDACLAKFTHDIIQYRCFLALLLLYVVVNVDTGKESGDCFKNEPNC